MKSAFAFYSFLILFFINVTFVTSKVKCPQPPLKCIWCPVCPKGYTLIKSPCGCCYDRCEPDVPNECHECPQIECLTCPICKDNEILVKSPCDNCCLDKCVPKHIYCACPKPLCTPGSIQVYGPKPCRCPYCVKPEPGDKCYKSINGSLTCGEDITNLICCNKICQESSKPCRVICHCPLIKCAGNAVIVPGPKPCKCPNCIVPKPGDKCLKTIDGSLSCGSDLVCCDGVCQKK